MLLLRSSELPDDGGDQGGDLVVGQGELRPRRQLDGERECRRGQGECQDDIDLQRKCTVRAGQPRHLGQKRDNKDRCKAEQETMFNEPFCDRSTLMTDTATRISR